MRVAAVACFTMLLISCASQQASKTPAPETARQPPSKVEPKLMASTASSEYTEIYVHNVVLQKATNLHLKVRWLFGRMRRTNPEVYPSLDDPGSFAVEIEDGAIAASLDELSKFLNESILQNASLKNAKLTAQGNQLKMTATFVKIVPLPIQMIADVRASDDGHHVLFHIVHLDVLKIPVKGLLSTFKLQAADLIDPKKTKGVMLAGPDIYIDTSLVLPPPREVGKLTDVHIKNGDLVEVYGSAHQEVQHLKQWRNFIRLRGGTVSLGKLTMEHTDILVVDASPADWFYFDLANYPEQIVNGETHITPQAGLLLLVPDFNKIPRTVANRSIGMQWLKNRNIPPPMDGP